MHKPTLALTMFFLLLDSALARESEIVWMEYPDSGIVLGQGYDLLEDRPVFGSCVDFVPVQDPSQKVRYNFDLVRSTTDIKSKTKISASGAMRMAVLKASAQLSFLSDEKFTLNTDKFYLSARVENSALFASPSIATKLGALLPDPTGAITGLPVEIKSKWVEKLINKKRIKLTDGPPIDTKLCGHGFVGVIIGGAALDAFLTYSKKDARSLAVIKGNLEADIAKVFSVKGSFEQRQTANTTAENTKISVFSYGGVGREIAYDLKSLKSSLQSLVKDAITKPKPIRIGIVPYTFVQTQNPIDGSYTANTFADEINSYFLVKDAFDVTESVLEETQNIPPDAHELSKGGAPIIRSRDSNIDVYKNMNLRASKLASQISTMLIRCQPLVREANEMPADRDGKTIPTARAREIKISANKYLGSPLRSGIDTSAISIDGSAGGNDIEALVDALDSTYAKAMQAFQMYEDTAVGYDDAAKHCKGVIETGDEEKDGTNGQAQAPFFVLAKSAAALLSAGTIAIKPIYWSELGQRYQRKLIAHKDISDPNKKETEIFETLKEYHDLYRSSKILRDICSIDFTHPLCRIDAEDWLVSASLSTTQLELFVAQFDKEAN